jgi:MraZ protein
MLLTGQYRRTLDDKLRLALPKTLREALTEGSQPLFVAPGQDRCLAVYSTPQFSKLAERLESASPAAVEVRIYSRLFYSRAVRADLDVQGRLRIPAELASVAELTGEVVLLGVRDHLELWRPEHWDDYAGRFGADYDAFAEQAFLGMASESRGSVGGRPSTDGQAEDRTEGASRPTPIQPR